MSDLIGDKDALIEAVMEWWCERSPDDPGDARLMQALWRYEGDHTEPCEGCDGDCGEACAPRSAPDAIAHLDQWIEKYNEKRGIRVVAITSTSREGS